jgi:predicted secreted hydrolase
MTNCRCFEFFILAAAFLAFVLTGMGAYADAADQWQLALEPRAWIFPRDHGAHPAYRTEWWYFTGNLKDDTGNQYGYQLTFFRHGLREQTGSNANAWSVRDIYSAHFTIIDVSIGQFFMDERMSRSGPGLAGALTEQMNVWLFDWKAKMEKNTIFLEAHNNEQQLKLELKPRKPLVFHGDRGLSKKGSKKGQASYYTSFTDLETRGRIQTKPNEPQISVQGTSWFDHEFGSTQLSRDQEGWDWFGLHLSDGRDLMIYLLRKTDKTINQESSGTIIEPDGSFRHLKLSDFSVTILDTWKSPKSSGQYPCKWRIAIPSSQIDILISSLVPDQELDTRQSTGIIYWEGAVAGKGTSANKQAACEGYVELTGYAGSLGGIF